MAFLDTPPVALHQAAKPIKSQIEVSDEKLVDFLDSLTLLKRSEVAATHFSDCCHFLTTISFKLALPPETKGLKALNSLLPFLNCSFYINDPEEIKKELTLFKYLVYQIIVQLLPEEFEKIKDIQTPLYCEDIFEEAEEMVTFLNEEPLTEEERGHLAHALNTVVGIKLARQGYPDLALKFTVDLPGVEKRAVLNAIAEHLGTLNQFTEALALYSLLENKVDQADFLEAFIERESLNQQCPEEFIFAAKTLLNQNRSVYM